MAATKRLLTAWEAFITTKSFSRVKRAGCSNFIRPSAICILLHVPAELASFVLQSNKYAIKRSFCQEKTTIKQWKNVDSFNKINWRWFNSLVEVDQLSSRNFRSKKPTFSINSYLFKMEAQWCHFWFSKSLRNRLIKVCNKAQPGVKEQEIILSAV